MIPDSPRSLLIIQTAFTGDVILATALIEKLHLAYPAATIDFLLRKGNEGLLAGHPIVRKVLVWDKKKGKIRNLVKIIGKIRTEKYSVVINVQRFATSGIVTMLSGAQYKIGFTKNPFSFFFDFKAPHVIGDGTHETARNQKLIEHFTDSLAAKPKLYPSPSDAANVAGIVQQTVFGETYYCAAPTSVWFTKQYPPEKWNELLTQMKDAPVFLLGAPTDYEICELIRVASSRNDVINLAGKLSFLESATIMKTARMNYVNDSAPMHIASAMNAPVTAIFCSTIPEFGFGPLSDDRHVVETRKPLDCRPCGLHGYKACPQGHFKCALTIDTHELVNIAG